MAISLKPIEEQVVVITGASSGIGLATAELACQRGARVVMAARSEQTLAELVEQIISGGGDVASFTCDVTKPDEVLRLAEFAVERYGQIDTWVNNAGMGMYGRIDETDLADDRQLFEINFWGVVHGSCTALPYLRRQGGALINIGSEVSEAVMPMLGMYSASKHAVKGFTDALRAEIQEIDQAPISITLIQPTAVDTPFPEHARNYTAGEPRLPTPRVEPKDVAEAILDAAVNPTATKKVGLMATVNTAMAKVAPSLAAKMSAKRIGELEYDEPPRRPEGTLFRSGESLKTAGRTHGVGGEEKSK
jgi:short-subunit dehydrogenase